jgi:RNA-directed DNA polymerase
MKNSFCHTLRIAESSDRKGSLKEYWAKRTQKQIAELVPSKQKMARKQNFLCPVCSQSLFNGEELHVHHILPREAGGEEKYKNLLLLHEDCTPKSIQVLTREKR